jgi:hypothetical protein
MNEALHWMREFLTRWVACDQAKPDDEALVRLRWVDRTICVGGEVFIFRGAVETAREVQWLEEWVGKVALAQVRWASEVGP